MFLLHLIPFLLPFSFARRDTFLYKIFTKNIIETILFQMETFKSENYKRIERESSILAWVPHGITPFAIYFHDNPNSIIYVASAPYYFCINLFLFLFYQRGGIVPVNKKLIVEGIKRKKQICLYPGGMQEISICDENDLLGSIYEKHFGFSSIAFEHNVPLIPVVVINENNLMYDASKNYFYRKWNIPLIFPFFNANYRKKLIINYLEPLYPTDFASVIKLHEAFYGTIQKFVENNK